MNKYTKQNGKVYREIESHDIEKITERLADIKDRLIPYYEEVLKTNRKELKKLEEEAEALTLEINEINI